MASAVTVGSILDRQRLRIQEIINRNITVFSAMLNPIWRTISTSQGVGSESEFGRDLKIIKVFMGAYGGVMEQGVPYGNFTLFGDTTATFGPKLHTQGLSRVYPNPLGGPNATPYRLAVHMRSMPTNLLVTLGEKDMEAVDATIGQVVAPKLIGFARMAAKTICNYFYLSQNSSYVLDTISAITISGDLGGFYRITFEPANHATARFNPGDRVDIYLPALTNRKNDSQSAAASQDHSTRLPLFVETRNLLTRKVTLVSNTDPTGWAGAAGADPTNGDVVVYANSKLGAGAFTGIAGINSWLKSGIGNPAVNDVNNVLLGTEADATDFINVDVHPEFQSFLKAVNGSLTEHKLRQYLARCNEAWEPLGREIDFLAFSPGVLLHYESQKIGQYRIDRTTMPSNLNNEGSRKGFRFTFDGRDYEGYTDNSIESGTGYGLRIGGQNWKRYVPPSASGVKKGAPNMDSYVPFEFVAPALTGTGSTMMPIYATGTAALQPSLAFSGQISLPTDGSQMPGRIRLQLIPDYPNMMKLTGMTEDRVYGDVLGATVSAPG